jgi:MFS family permease
MHMTEATGTKKYGIAVKIAVLVLMFVQNTQAMVTPTLAAIAAEFPDAATTTVQMVNTIPTIIMIFSAALCSPLIRKMGYKRAGLLGMLFSLVGGVLPAFLHMSVELVIFERAVFGIGYGMVFALAVAAAGDFWQGKETSQMVGLVSAFAGIAGIFFSLVSGVLTDINWTAPFWFNFIIVVFAVYYAFVMPHRSELVKDVPADALEKKTFSLKGFGQKYWVFLILTTFCIGTMTAFINNIALAVVGLELGTGATIGLIMTGFSVGLMLGALAYIPVYRVLKRTTLPLYVLIYGLMMLVTVLVPVLPMFFACGFVCGLGFGGINAGWMDMANKKPVDPNRSSDGSSFFIAMQGVGQFVGPFWLAGVVAAFGLTSADVFYQWYPAIGILIVAGIVLIGFAVANRNKVDYEKDQSSGRL